MYKIVEASLRAMQCFTREDNVPLSSPKEFKLGFCTYGKGWMLFSLFSVRWQHFSAPTIDFVSGLVGAFDRSVFFFFWLHANFNIKIRKTRTIVIEYIVENNRNLSIRTEKLYSTSFFVWNDIYQRNRFVWN